MDSNKYQYLYDYQLLEGQSTSIIDNMIILSQQDRGPASLKLMERYEPQLRVLEAILDDQ